MYPYLQEKIVMVEGPGAVGIYNLNKGTFERSSIEAGRFLKSLNGTIPLSNFNEEEQEFVNEAANRDLVAFKNYPQLHRQTELNEVIKPLRPVRFAWLEITSKCNQRCRHCFVGDQLNKFSHVPKEKIFEYVKVLDEAGVRQIILSGGEPTLHPDLENIIDHIGTYRFRIALLTNASTPKLQALIPCLLRNDVTVKIPLLGWEESHDKMAGAKNCFSKTIKNIKLLAAAGIELQLGTTVTAINYQDIPKICEFANMHSLPLEVSPIYAVGWAKKYGDEVLTIPMNEVLKICKESSNNKKVITHIQKKPVRAHQYKADPYDYDAVNLKDYLTEHAECGQKIIAILANGSVTPCLMLRENQHTIGSVRTHSLKEILSNSFSERKAFDEMMLLKNVPGCGKCEARFICKAGGCPASAYALTGNINAKNPLYDRCYYLNDFTRAEMGLAES